MEYTEEEKKAIEVLEKYRKIGYGIMLEYNNDRIKTNRVIETTIDTILNLLEKKDKRIHYLENEARGVVEKELNKAQVDLYKNYIPKEAVREFVREKIEEEDYVEDNIDTDIAPASHDKYINARELLELLGE